MIKNCKETSGTNEDLKINEAIKKKGKEIDIELVKILRNVGTDIRAVIIWLRNGGQRDWDTERMNRDWQEGEKESLCNLGNKSISEILKTLTEWQVEVFELLNNQNNGIHKTSDDYFHDAKRHISFLIAEMIMERCVKGLNKNKVQCFQYLHEAFIPYLITLSIEEFIRIKAYLLWGMENNWVPVNDRQKDEYYFLVQDVVEYAQRNCFNQQPGMLENFIHNDTKSYFQNKNSIDINSIINAKLNADNRLKITHPNEVGDYTSFFYNKIQDVLKKGQWDASTAIKIVELIYKHADIPNMLEYFLRCYICTHFTIQDHEEIRMKYNRRWHLEDYNRNERINRLFPRSR